LEGKAFAKLLPSHPDTIPVIPPIKPVTITIMGTDNPPNSTPVFEINPLLSFPDIHMDITVNTANNEHIPIQTLCFTGNFINIANSTTEAAGAHQGPNIPATVAPMIISRIINHTFVFILE
jgi:hypothetical protein